MLMTFVICLNSLANNLQIATICMHFKSMNPLPIYS